LGGDLGTGLERRPQPLDVHDRELLARGVPKALQLRHAALQGHLPALEPELRVVARAPALGASAGCLALPGRAAAAHTAAVPLGALRGLEVMELHSSTSSTVTRWETFRTMPRISGRSSFTTESRIRCSPSARTVAFWSFGRSMTLRVWVMRSLL